MNCTKTIQLVALLIVFGYAVDQASKRLSFVAVAVRRVSSALSPLDPAANAGREEGRGGGAKKLLRGIAVGDVAESDARGADEEGADDYDHDMLPTAFHHESVVEEAILEEPVDGFMDAMMKDKSMGDPNVEIQRSSHDEEPMEETLGEKSMDETKDELLTGDHDEGAVGEMILEESVDELMDAIMMDKSMGHPNVEIERASHNEGPMEEKLEGGSGDESTGETKDKSTALGSPNVVLDGENPLKA
ncbi:hypothetical protein ACHAWF_014140 [Thalassiosira exigua]